MLPAMPRYCFGSQKCDNETITNSLATDIGAIGATATYVQRLNQGLFVTDGTRIRLTFRAPAGGAFQADNVFVGHKSPTGDPYDFDETPTRVTFGGANSTGSITAGTTLASDTVVFAYDSNRDMLIAFDIAAAASNIAAATPSANYDLYFKTPAAEASTVNKTGYTTVATGQRSVQTIEKFA